MGKEERVGQQLGGGGAEGGVNEQKPAGGGEGEAARG